MVEQGEPIDRPAVYRTVMFAFAIWTAHFMLSYGAVLVFPEQPIARWIALAALLLALAALFAWARHLATPRPLLALAALGLSLAAIGFGTLPAIVG